MSKGTKLALKPAGGGVVVRECVSADAVLGPDGAAGPHAPDAVTAQYRRAVAGALEMVRFGAMLVEIDASLTRETRNGCIQDGETLKGWLEAHCPDVNYKTAMRFKALAEGVQQHCRLPAKVPLSLAMPGPDGAPAIPENCPIAPGKLKKIQQEVWELVEGRSARQLMFAFGAEGEGGAKGGANHTSRLTEEEKHAEMLKAAHAVWTKGVDALVDNVKRLQSHKLLDGGTLAALRVKLGIVAEALKEASAGQEQEGRE